MSTPTFRPILIIGAARSGTNMLRNALCALPGLRTWACDELPFLWRYGNESLPTDEFTRAEATAGTKEFIRRQFRLAEMRFGTPYVVEKTCANSLRVGFVDAVLPEARFVVIVRDGFDALTSAMSRWQAPLDLGYSLRKLRYVPVRAMLPLGLQVLRNRVQYLASAGSRVALWGPRFDGMVNVVRCEPLHVVCAIQWNQCVRFTDRDLTTIDATRTYRIRYEDIVSDRVGSLRDLANWLDVDAPPQAIDSAASAIQSRSVGKGRRALSAVERAAVEPIIADCMRRHGYHLGAT